MTFGIPQIIYLTLIFTGLGLDIARHGKPREGNHSASGTFFANCIILVLLYWGGFFG